MRKHEEAKCELCPFVDSGKYVPTKKPEVPTSNPIAFIGESPGRQEVRKGEPFIGPSGQLLRGAIRSHGLDDKRMVFTNAISCHFPNQHEKDKEQLKQATECCRPRLIAELKELGAVKAVGLGNIGVSSVLDTDTNITRLRAGFGKKSDYVDGLDVIPTFHPAYCLRSQNALPLMTADIGKVLPGRNKIVWSDPPYNEILGVKEAHELLDKILSIKSEWPLVTDIENGKDKDEDVERGTDLLCVGLSSYNPKAGDTVFVIGRPAIDDPWVREKLCEALASRGVVTQNGKTDVKILNLSKAHAVKIRIVKDTMYMSYSLYEYQGVHSLQYMGVEYLGSPAWKEEIKKFLKKPHDPWYIRTPALKHVEESLKDGPQLRADVVNSRPEGVPSPAIGRAAAELGVVEYKDDKAEYKKHQWRWWLDSTKKIYLAPEDADGSYASVPPEILHKYNARDVHATKLAARYFESKMAKKPELVRLNKFLMDGVNKIIPMEEKGMKVDLDYNWQLEEEYREKLANLAEFPFDPASPTKIKEYFRGTLGIRTDTTNAEFLNGVVESGTYGREITELCEQLLDYRHLAKFKSTYITAIRNKAELDPNGHIHPEFHLHKTVTGRLSSSNPNAQNIPRESKIKNQFIPSSPDRVFVKADYPQLELRILTWLAKDKNMIELFNDQSVDVFVNMCISMWGDEFLKSNDAAKKELRSKIKTMAYGLAYGRGADAIAKAFGISLGKATEQMYQFYEMVPDIIEFQESVVKKVYRGEDLVTPFGRHRRFYLINRENKVDVANEAKATLPQSIGSDCTLLSLIRMPEWVDLRNIVHDEIMAEAPIGEEDKVGRELCRVMRETAEEVVEGLVPFPVEYTVGRSWGECK